MKLKERSVPFISPAAALGDFFCIIKRLEIHEKHQHNSQKNYYGKYKHSTHKILQKNPKKSATNSAAYN